MSIVIKDYVFCEEENTFEGVFFLLLFYERL